jgi:hypothetical protein
MFDLFRFFLWFLSFFVSETQAFSILFYIGQCLHKKDIKILRTPFLSRFSRFSADYNTIYRENFIEYQTKFQEPRGVIFYIHGGGLISGDWEGYKDFSYRIAELTKRDLVFPEYRLAPENKVRDMVDDLYKSYNAISSKNIIIVADSLGCYLANLLIEKIENKPCACIYVSPVSPYSLTKGDCMVGKEICEWVWNIIDKIPYRHHKICTYVVYSSNEGFAEDIEKEYSRDNCIIDSIESFHCYPLFFRLYGEGVKSIERIKRFINSIPRNYTV